LRWHPFGSFLREVRAMESKDARQQLCGSGWGGVWTARDDFLSQRRRTKWFQPVAKPVKPVPPRLYVDSKTIIREVTDVRTLRRGDHCLIAINLVRCVSPTIDHLISCLGSIELCYFYHHFIIMDDVYHVDEQGIPRTSQGELAEIMEYGNTIPEALRELRQAARGSLLRLPSVAARFLLCHKSKCHRMALADYGDTPHIYRVVESLTPQERERIVQDATQVVEHPSRYHVIFSNCEHISNHISRGCFTSPNVHFALWSFCRTVLYCIGLVILNIAAGSCYGKLCAAYPVGALASFYLLTSVPVLAQAAVSYALASQSVWRKYAQALITHDDFYHLLGKELGRMLLVGGTTTVAISCVPILASQTQYFATTCGFCAFAYIVSDLLYNCFAHAVMRLVLLPVWGRVWLIGAASPDCCIAKED